MKQAGSFRAAEQVAIAQVPFSRAVSFSCGVSELLGVLRNRSQSARCEVSFECTRAIGNPRWSAGRRCLTLGSPRQRSGPRLRDQTSPAQHELSACGGTPHRVTGVLVPPAQAAMIRKKGAAKKQGGWRGSGVPAGAEIRGCVKSTDETVAHEGGATHGRNRENVRASELPSPCRSR